MKKVLTLITLLLLALNGQAQSWNFKSLSSADETLLKSDGNLWKLTDSSKGRYSYQQAITEGALQANGQNLSITDGLLFTASGADKIRIDKNKEIQLNGNNIDVIIPNMKKGQKITVSFASSSTKTARTLTATNLTVTSGFEASKSSQTGEGTVTADGAVTLSSFMGGINLYSITVADSSGTVPSAGKTLHSVSRDVTQNQFCAVGQDGSVNYYNTSSLQGVNISDDNQSVKVAMTDKNGEVVKDTLTDVAQLSALKKVSSSNADGTFTNETGKVEIITAKGWRESAYITWKPFSGATSYRVQVKGENYATYTTIDQPLVRNYGTYGRADVVGLKAGTYSLKVIPVKDGTEVADAANEATDLTVIAYPRQDYAHFKYDNGIGAYNNDGTLKAGARVIYVTKDNAKTVSCAVVQDKKGTLTTFTGIQAILNAYQKGTDSTALAVRFIGCIPKDSLDDMLSNEGLQIKGRNAYSTLNITLEGIGNDATAYGFGFLVRNARSVEFRNFAIMLHPDDCISLDTKNAHIWIHHMDFFYGNAGSDADQAKGDGTVDLKDDSRYITTSYCRFWDTGKSSLCGMKSETGPNWIDYDHNWFDHSDSRHPRIRTMSVHVWNNYYDGVAKYGVGVTTGGNAFVDRNYFRDIKYPMMISQQGTDAKGDGTFSGEAGGMIKSYGNVFAEKGKLFSYITQKDDATNFDAYEAATADEKVPESYKSVVGSYTYSNFDTDENLMYVYRADDPVSLPALITGFYGAGRINHGDFQFSLTNDEDYGVNTALKTALKNYKSSLVGAY
ncbi:MAG: pectate lyase [Prevotellaceae bacterium]|nr:pectate lyase [Prevotellaceae bacterium]